MTSILSRKKRLKQDRLHRKQVKRLLMSSDAMQYVRQLEEDYVRYAGVFAKITFSENYILRK